MINKQVNPNPNQPVITRLNFILKLQFLFLLGCNIDISQYNYLFIVGIVLIHIIRQGHREYKGLITS